MSEAVTSPESTESTFSLHWPWEQMLLSSSVASYRGLVLTFLRMLAPSFLADTESLRQGASPKS